MGLWRGLWARVSRDMGIDLGTCNSLVYVRGKGILLREPSVVATERITGKVLAVGAEAKRMIGRTPEGIVATRPLRDGVVADYEVTEQMLRYFLTKVHHRQTLVHPTVMVGIPSGATEVERRALREAALHAGAREAFLIEEPMAAAIGAGLPVGEPIGSIVVDIGGGTSEVAVVSLNGVVTHRSLRIAGDEMDETIIAHLRQEYNLAIGERTAEEIKIQAGSAHPSADKARKAVARGRDLYSGLPKSVEVEAGEIREALAGPVDTIVECVKLTLEDTPPELSGDIMEQGILLTGGGSLLSGLDRLLEEETKIPVRYPDDALTCVVLGAGRALEQLNSFKECVYAGRW